VINTKNKGGPHLRVKATKRKTTYATGRRRPMKRNSPKEKNRPGAKISNRNIEKKGGEMSKNYLSSTAGGKKETKIPWRKKNCGSRRGPVGQRSDKKKGFQWVEVGEKSLKPGKRGVANTGGTNAKG